jgi:hypothetical protein
MTARTRRLAIVAVVAIATLFAGRWTATFLVERWWGELQSPAAAEFLTDLGLLRLVLDVAAAVIAAAWFTGHLLIVYRAIGSVEISRRLANLEVREALTRDTLLWMVVVAGIVLGLLVGGDAERHWREVVLAWHGVRFGITEPVLRHDAGVYLAQLPLWSLVIDYAWMLVAGALALVPLLYVVIGALRWIEGRPAISDHARRHLGWLLCAVALLFALGFLLEPVRLVGGAEGLAGARRFQLAALSAPVLAGVALSVALLSVVWAFRPHHALVLAGWLVFGAAVFVARVIGAALVEPDDVPLGDAPTRSRFDALAYDTGAVSDSVVEVQPTPGPEPQWPALWQTEAVIRAGDADSFRTVAADPAWLQLRTVRRPVWIAVGTRGGATFVRAIADDRASATGAPLYYAPGDTQPGPAPVALIELGADAIEPSAAPVRITADGPGAPVGMGIRRLFLAWALQDGRLLGSLDARLRVQWERSPVGRLRRLAPFAEWVSAVPRIVDGELVWVADGYLTAREFPLSSRVALGNASVGYLRAAFVGVVDARTGRARLFARPDAGPVAVAWSEVAAGVVEPWTALSDELRDAVPYPAELFRAQSRLLQPAAGGQLVGVADSVRRTPAVYDYAWSPDVASPVRVAAYEHGSPPAVGSLLLGEMVGGRMRLRRLEVEPREALPGPSNLTQAWGRFPSFERAVDSVRGGGGTLSPGGVRYWFGPGELGALQAHYGPRGGGGASLTWVSVAAHGRLGAGRSVPEAWGNLRGASAPLPPGYQPQSALTEARRWFQRADSALRVGDFAGFGRAFEALGATLDVQRASPR